jgi:HPt (histidine-containing phosphotransfer) domain-containing protein
LESETASIESSAPDSDTLFDSTLLLEWMENDRALACSLARDFMNDITSQLEEMEQAIKSEDIQEMKQYAHTIKGMSANMACGRLRHLAAMFENSAAHSDTETLRAHYHELRKVFGKTFAHVIAFINEKSE